MLTLHGIWHNERLHLWGGTQDASGTLVPVGCAELHAALGELSSDGLLTTVAEDGELVLALPQPGGLAQVAAPTLQLAPAEALDLLGSLAEPPPRECGATLRYWALLARYLLSRLAAKRFVPDVHEARGEAPQAAWRLVVTHGEEHEWIEAVARCMPAACRAVAASATEPVDALPLVENFLLVSADAAIRRALAADEFFHQIHERAAAPASPPEVRWLAALIGADRAIKGSDEDRVALVNHVRGWVGRLHETGREVPTRLCFELIEPDDLDDDDDEYAVALAGAEQEDPLELGAGTEGGPARAVGALTPASDRPPAPVGWRLRYLLQDLDAAGKLHDVRAVWREEGGSNSLLGRRFASRREQLMADLGRAAEVFPPIGESLKQEAPAEMGLSAVQAHLFLRDGAPLLEARGFAVRVPEWATRPERRLGLKLFVSPARDSRRDDGVQSIAPARLGLGSLVDFEWRVAVGDADLTVEEFERLCAAKGSLIRLRGEWILVESESAQTAADFLTRQRQGRMTLGEAMRAAAGAADAEVGLPVVGLRGTAWIAELLEGLEGIRLIPQDQPQEFKGEMRPYQLRGLAWLRFMERIGLGACLADDMGLGKTIQLIALLLSARHEHGGTGPTLIFAPMSVVGNWKREIERFAPQLKVFVHHGPDRLTQDDFVRQAGEHDAVITTYALGHRDLTTLNRVPWHRIVLDEAQKVKNPGAAQTIAIRSLGSVHRTALTGTPLENHLSELWSIMEMVNPGLLGSAADFRRRFAVPVERLGDQNRANQLKTLIRPFVLRRVKTDPLVQNDLPEKMEMRVFCNLTAEQAALYEQVTHAALSEIERASGIRRRGVILAALTRLKQICNHPTHYLRDGATLDARSGKCERLVEMLEEVLAEGDAALVFTQFKEMGDLLIKLIAERLHHDPLFLHGGTPAKQRTEFIDRFQDPAGGVRIFVLSLRAGGLGLNLTAANHVFHFDRWWNPAVEEQATDRAYRIGQTRRVQVHKFVCIGTIEDRIDRMLTEKTALADRIVGAGDDWLTSLSTEELRSYFALSSEAVSEE